MIEAWWLPAAISRYAAGHDAQFTRTVVISIIIFIAAQVSLAAVVWRFRSRAGSEREPKTGGGHSRAELAWTAATAVLFLGLLAAGSRIWASVQFSSAHSDAEPIEVLGRQFAWSFRYPGKDGQFGRTGIRQVNDASGDPFGLDPDDPSGKDDLISATLRIPAGRRVKLMLHSRDVIHSFFLREMRIKQDLVPGMEIPLELQADVPGTYEIPCAELCGLGHHQMRTTLIVMTAADYDAWKRGQAQ